MPVCYSLPLFPSPCGAFSTSTLLWECRRCVESCFSMHTFTILTEWAAKPWNRPAWYARSCATAPPSCTLNYRGEQREKAARAVRGAKYSLTTNRIPAALKTAGRTKARILLRTFSRFFLDSVGDRGASVSPQRVARMTEHNRRSILKSLRSSSLARQKFSSRFLQRQMYQNCCRQPRCLYYPR